MRNNHQPEADAVPFIVFSDDWGIHPSSSQHIFRHIAENHPVAWINTIGMRRPTLTLTDLKKGIRKLGNMLQRTGAGKQTAASEPVAVYQPTMIPFNDVPTVRRLNRRLVEKTLRSVEKALPGGPPIVVTTVPNASDYIDTIDSRKIVYYCVDDFSEWPGLDRELIIEMENELVRKSDLFLATSAALEKRLSQSGKPTVLLPHGVDIGLFSTEADSEHAVLQDIPAPRAGYFGLFDARSDQTLISAVARAMPDVSFVIAGRVETPIERLQAVKNVHFTGPIPYRELPALIKGLDLLFIPYIVNALTDALSPLKFKEYLATGRPVLSTPIAAAAEFERHIDISDDANEWQGVIRSSLGIDHGLRREALAALLDGESWEEKARLFLHHCFA